MAITHTLVVTGTNDGTKQVSKNEWNDDHTIAINTILPIPNIADNTDTTKDIQFTLSGATTATTMTLVSSHTANRTITLPDATLTLIGNSSTDTLTNKSIDSDNNTITNIVNADIKAAAGIVLTKIEAITAGQIIVGSATNVATQVAVTGDISITDAGVTAIATGAIVDGDLSTATYSSITGLGTQTIDLEMGGFNIQTAGVMTLLEQAAANVDVAAEGQVWVKTATPNQLWFTDDAGTDFQLASLAGTETLTNKTISQSQITSLTSDLALKSPLASPTFTGTVVLPNVPAIVTTQLNLKSPLASPTFTGTVVLPDSQALVTPVLGTPTSGTLTNCTGLPLAGLATSAKTEAIGIAGGDETTVLAVADGVTEFQLPYGFELTSVRATLTTAGTTSGVTTIDIEDDGTSIFATLLTIDATEKTSTSAATPFDFTASASSLTLGDGSVMKINVDVLSAGATEAGLKIWLIGYQT